MDKLKLVQSLLGYVNGYLKHISEEIVEQILIQGKRNVDVHVIIVQKYFQYVSNDQCNKLFLVSSTFL